MTDTSHNENAFTSILAHSFREQAVRALTDDGEHLPPALSRVGPVLPVLEMLGHPSSNPELDFLLSQQFITQTIGGLLIQGRRDIAVQCLQNLVDRAWEDTARTTATKSEAIIHMENVVRALVEQPLRQSSGIHPDFPQIATDVMQERINAYAANAETDHTPTLILTSPQAAA